MANLKWAATGALQPGWKPVGYGLDMPDIPNFLPRESPQSANSIVRKQR
jgi:hypothetical protein